MVNIVRTKAGHVVGQFHGAERASRYTRESRHGHRWYTADGALGGYRLDNQNAFPREYRIHGWYGSVLSESWGALSA